MRILQEEAQDHGKLFVAVKWARKQLSSFRTEERRKVLGITPFAAYTSLSTKELCKQIMRSMKAPTDFAVESAYLKNLSILRKFARTSTNVSQRGEFFKNFKIWLTESTSPSEDGHPSDEDCTGNGSQAESEDSVQHTGFHYTLSHFSAGSSQGSSTDHDDGHGPA